MSYTKEQKLRYAANKLYIKREFNEPWDEYYERIPVIVNAIAKHGQGTYKALAQELLFDLSFISIFPVEIYGPYKPQPYSDLHKIRSITNIDPPIMVYDHNSFSITDDFIIGVIKTK